MDYATPDAPDHRRAYLRVGAAALAVFAVLLLIGATRGPADASSSVPASAPARTPAQTVPVQPSQPDPQQVVPSAPGGPGPGFGFGHHHHDGEPAPPDGGSAS